MPEYVTSETEPVESLDGISSADSTMREDDTHDLTLMRIPYIDLTTVLPEIVIPEAVFASEIEPIEIP